MRIATVLGCSLVVLVSGCSVAPKDFARLPHMTPVGAGLDKRQPIINVNMGDGYPGAEKGSLGRPPSADLFRDPRARRVGDTLTVKIAIKDKASIDSTSNRSKTAKGELKAGLDYEVGTKGFVRAGTVSGDANVDATSSHNGKGAISRSENIELLVAAIVTHELPNGNLVISGTQEVRVNYEVRVLTVAGIVRPRDISGENTIAYDKIAEARISYGGRGRIMEVQQPNWGQQILDIISPY